MFSLTIRPGIAVLPPEENREYADEKGYKRNQQTYECYGYLETISQIQLLIDEKEQYPCHCTKSESYDYDE